MNCLGSNFYFDHRYVTSYKAQEKMKSGERTVRMSIVDEDSEYMAGHVVDGKNTTQYTTQHNT